MAEDQGSDFKIRIDEDEPARILLGTEVENQQINKLRRRITFISVFTLCLLALALTYAYIDIKKQVGNFQTSGSQDVESRFSSLSVKYAQIEADFSNKITTLENNLAALKTSLGQGAVSSHKSLASLEQKLKTIQVDKADKEALSILKNEITDTVAAFNHETESLSGILKDMDDESAAMIVEVQKELAAIDKKMADLQSSVSDLAALSAHWQTKKQLKAALHAQSVDFQNKIDELTTLLNRNDDKIENLIARLDSLQKKFSKLAGTVPTAPNTAGISGNKLSSNSPSEKNGVKEQNIQ